jgi:hypothetical protein
MMLRRTSRKRLAAAATLILAAAAAACESILDTTEDLADNARVFVTGSSPVLLELVLSNDFTAVENAEGNFDVTMAESDTFRVTPPYERAHPIGQTGRIFVRLTQPDSTVTASVRLRVQLDDREVYDRQATLRNASLEYLFVYF